MAKISIPGIAGAVSSKHGLSKQDAEKFVTVLFDLINEGLYLDKIVKVKGLGTFKIIDVRERESVNVNTGERVTIGGHGKITFTPDPVMRDLVNKPFAQFETVILNDGVDVEELNTVQTVGESDYEDDKITDTNEDCITATGEEDVSANVPVKEEDTDVEDVDSYMENVPEADSNVADLQYDIEDKDAREAISDNVEQAIEQEKTQEPEFEENPVEDTPEHDTSMIPEPEEDENPSYEAPQPFILRHKWLCFAFIPLIIACAAFLAGFYYNKYTAAPTVKYIKVYVYKKQPSMPLPADSFSNRDTVRHEVKAVSEPEDKADVATPVKADIMEDEIVDKKISADNEATLRRARAMVNTGAYRIVGTDATVTVKKGESLKQISKFYFGEGMECYVQVHNGIAEVKEGQKLKIPKLANKKKRK